MTTPSTPAEAPRRRVGRPIKAVLTHESIVGAALELVTDKGYEGLTMSAMAKKLGVSPSALYNHVTNKQEVLILIEDHLAAQVDVSAFGTQPWEEAVRHWAWSYREVFAQHTPLIPIIAVLPVTNAPRTLAMYEAVSAGFRQAGFPQERIVPAVVALESFIFGSAYDATAPEDIFDTGASAASTPNFTTAVNRFEEAEGGSNPDRAFTMGLDALIGGFRSFLPLPVA
ncbi:MULTISPECIES: TetR/AcrR family transcriptional regulator C-terminal domain-containing protein [Arthrobacter]|uniref:TetR/AcrR family transcriptional regulator C-terminal domain-containing protein n=2 Tax=Arthrobacter TaxID=1663 RepID=A0ABU9KIV1_9MICC|nr:TetR/AcrR family transcriptional regulator C-terminal domain-containing protein [Arthrobacter sp. YJM1]MDP5226940.1 TetR/AcrR family transcriptional regulator C-terminal domain-containing protein [Arthrobacter sp. YJM1]